MENLFPLNNNKISEIVIFYDSLVMRLRVVQSFPPDRGNDAKLREEWLIKIRRDEGPDFKVI